MRAYAATAHLVAMLTAYVPRLNSHDVESSTWAGGLGRELDGISMQGIPAPFVRPAATAHADGDEDRQTISMDAALGYAS